jgi:hypothetical protein
MSIRDLTSLVVFSFFCFVYAFLLCGCFTGERQENTATVRQETRSGIEAGKTTQLTVVTREQIQTAEKSSAGIDVAAAIQATLAAAEGRFGDMLAAAKPAPLDLAPLLSRIDQVNASISAPKQNPTDWPTLITTGAVALATAGVTHGVNKSRELRRHGPAQSKASA